ncbi:MAG: permease of phosphate ABC transporter [Ruminococcaceae bacterium]|nr:permease of phosphate ABC transporter [Oscillospiraceae bacterium]
MKTLFSSADEYLKLSSWKDLTLIKFCLFSMGVLVGTYAKRDTKKQVRIAAAAVFVLTYIPLMVKYALVLIKTINDSKKV